MKPQIEVLADISTLARRVADRIQQQARSAIKARGRFTLVLTGGDSPVPLYVLLAEDTLYKEFPWEHTLCFFGDERHVPADHPDSNYWLACQTLFRTGRVPAKNVFRFYTEIADSKEAAAEYENRLREHFPEKECLNGFPRFDVLLLGLGANGHTASLFPCTAGLDANTCWVVANKVPELGKDRLTLTFPALNAAREIYLESINPKTRTTVADVLRAEELKFYPFPVQKIAPTSGKYYWFLTDATAPQGELRL